MGLAPGGVELIAVCAVFTLVSTVVVALRLCGRMFQRSKLRSHDYWICLALVFTWGLAIDQIIGVPLGATGKHIQDATPNEVTNALKSYVAAAFLWLFSTTCIKVSITLLYMDIFAIPKFMKAGRTMLCIVAAFFIGFLFVLALGCIPFRKYYEPETPGRCIPATASEIATAAVNMFVDILLILLPMPVVWGLKMPTRKKVWISFCFGMGALVIAINIVRIYISSTDDKADFTYSLTNLALYASLEVWLGLLAACLPTMKPVISRFFKSARNDSPNLRYTGDHRTRSTRRLRHASRASKPIYATDTPDRDAESFYDLFPAEGSKTQNSTGSD